MSEQHEPIDLTRRSVLGASAIGVAMLPIVPTPAAAASKTSSRLYSRKRFRALRGKRFRLVTPSGRWRVRLTKVSNLPGATRGSNKSFALTFRTKKAGPPQGTYELRRKGFATTTLFIVPSDATRRTYQVVVNRGR